jgi:hypothetical protein
MPATIKLFEELLITAAIVWLAAVFLGHEAHVMIASQIIGINGQEEFVGKVVYALLLSVTAFISHIIYLVSRGGHNFARVIYILICAIGFVAACLGIPTIVYFYSINMLAAAMQIFSFGIMLIAAALIAISDTGDWFHLSVKCRRCKKKLMESCTSPASLSTFGGLEPPDHGRPDHGRMESIGEAADI